MGWSFALAGGGHRAPSCRFPTFWDAIPWRIYAATVPLDGQLQGSSEAYYPVAVEVGPWWYWLSATLAVNSLSQQNQTKMPWTLNRPWCDGYTHSLSSNTSDWHTRGPVHLCTGYGAMAESSAYALAPWGHINESCERVDRPRADGHCPTANASQQENGGRVARALGTSQPGLIRCEHRR